MILDDVETSLEERDGCSFGSGGRSFQVKSLLRKESLSIPAGIRRDADAICSQISC
jgi:hypothetical protein